LTGTILFIRNLPLTATEDELSSKFGECGAVVSAKIALDTHTGRSKGFGFIEMGSGADAAAAIRRLNYTNYDGRVMSVSVAHSTDAPSAQMPDTSVNRRFDQR
jgi:cold-inducible RNA-binding protein